MLKQFQKFGPRLLVDASMLDLWRITGPVAGFSALNFKSAVLLNKFQSFQPELAAVMLKEAKQFQNFAETASRLSHGMPEFWICLA